MIALSDDVRRNNGDLCKSCRAAIVWATTPKGKALPVDPELVHGGNIALDVDELGMLKARVVRPVGDVEAYVAHFTSCPNASEHRHNGEVPAPAASHDEQLVEKRKALTCTMPFGKFVGQTLEEIDRDRRGHGYLEWAYKNLEFREPSLKRAIGVVLGVEP
jgi:uncharacterized protein (DUF3820 family)